MRIPLHICSSTAAMICGEDFLQNDPVLLERAFQSRFVIFCGQNEA